ncbi:MAG: aminodeoxychorismate/anthranilate synthase component II [Planctomycetales bacterium]|nr:aminodeoxychorismate/anthranilate synthase component II [Planctomycetales bacterium]
MILLVDNYDSFVFNLWRYFLLLGQNLAVVRNDRLPMKDIEQFQAVVISPGPKAPQDAGQCIELVREFSGKLPILGVCLGHQVICEAFGGRIIRAREPMHGRASPIQLEACQLFANIESPQPFARYHSLIADPESLNRTPLQVIASSHLGEVMAVQHANHITIGVQFHPESVLSLSGLRLLANFCQLAGLSCKTAEIDSDLMKMPIWIGNKANDQEGDSAISPAVVIPSRYSYPQ